MRATCSKGQDRLDHRNVGWLAQRRRADIIRHQGGLIVTTASAARELLACGSGHKDLDLVIADDCPPPSESFITRKDLLDLSLLPSADEPLKALACDLQDALNELELLRMSHGAADRWGRQHVPDHLSLTRWAAAIDATRPLWRKACDSALLPLRVATALEGLATAQTHRLTLWTGPTQDGSNDSAFFVADEPWTLPSTARLIVLSATDPTWAWQARTGRNLTPFGAKVAWPTDISASCVRTSYLSRSSSHWERDPMGLLTRLFELWHHKLNVVVLARRALDLPCDILIAAPRWLTLGWQQELSLCAERLRKASGADSVIITYWRAVGTVGTDALQGRIAAVIALGDPIRALHAWQRYTRSALSPEAPPEQEALALIWQLLGRSRWADGQPMLLAHAGRTPPPRLAALAADQDHFLDLPWAGPNGRPPTARLATEDWLKGFAAWGLALDKLPDCPSRRGLRQALDHIPEGWTWWSCHTPARGRPLRFAAPDIEAVRATLSTLGIETLRILWDGPREPQGQGHDLDHETPYSSIGGFVGKSPGRDDGVRGQHQEPPWEQEVEVDEVPEQAEDGLKGSEGSLKGIEGLRRVRQRQGEEAAMESRCSGARCGEYCGHGPGAS